MEEERIFDGPEPFTPKRIADLASDEKPREKALLNGIRTLSDAELLALLIGGGTQGKSAIDLGREIMSYCENSIDNLAQMSIRSISKQFKGIGTAKATTIAAAVELGSRRRHSEIKERQILTSEIAYNVLTSKMENQDHEEFWVLYLKRNNALISAECVSRGGSAATYVEPKLIIRHALERGASAMIVGHNHPSGNLRPSVQDDQLTRRISEAAKLLEIPLLDHLIVTSRGFYSYRDEGKI